MFTERTWRFLPMPPFKEKKKDFIPFWWCNLWKSESTTIAKMLKSPQGRKYLCLFFIVGKLRHGSVDGLIPDPVGPQWQNPRDAGSRLGPLTPLASSLCPTIPRPHMGQGKRGSKEVRAKPFTLHGPLCSAAFSDHRKQGIGSRSGTWQLQGEMI